MNPTNQFLTMSLPKKSNKYLSNPGCYIDVSFPDKFIQQYSGGKIMFTDGNKVNVYADLDIVNPVNPVRLYVPALGVITGKIIFLHYRFNHDYQIISYDNYGESPEMNLQPGNNYQFEFDSLDLLLNPGETSVAGTISDPSGYTSDSYFYLSFASSNGTYYDITIAPLPYRFSYLSGNAFNFIIPTGLPRSFYSIVETFTRGAQDGYSREEFYVYPNSSNNLQTKTYPYLISPLQSDSNVNTGTLFSYDGGNGNGVYIVNIHTVNFLNPLIEFHIVTTDKNITLEGLEETGIGSIRDTDFYWDVTKPDLQIQ